MNFKDFQAENVEKQRESSDRRILQGKFYKTNCKKRWDVTAQRKESSLPHGETSPKAALSKKTERLRDGAGGAVMEKAVLPAKAPDPKGWGPAGLRQRSKSRSKGNRPVQKAEGCHSSCAHSRSIRSMTSWICSLISCAHSRYTSSGWRKGSSMSYSSEPV